MLITYRKTGGLVVLFAVAAIALVAVFTAAVAAVVLVAGVFLAAAVSLARAALPRSWRRGGAPLGGTQASQAPYEILEGDVVAVDGHRTHGD